MILFINAVKSDIYLALIKNKGKDDQEIVGKLYSAGDNIYRRDLLNLIENLLKAENGDIAALKGIIVINGPGSFTSIRIALTTANLIAHNLKIPIVGLASEADEDNLLLIKNGLKLLEKQGRKKTLRKIIYPFYNQQPNITK